MSFFLDVKEDDLTDVNEIIKNGSYSLPLDSYPHPSDTDYHRMEFENESHRDNVKNGLQRRGFEALPLDGDLTSEGLFIEK